MSFNVQGSVSSLATGRYAAVKQQILDYSPDLLGLQEDQPDTWGTASNFSLEGYTRYCYDGTITGVDPERLAIYVKSGLTVKTSGYTGLISSDSMRALTYDDVKSGGKYALNDAMFDQLLALGSGSTDKEKINDALHNGQVWYLSGGDAKSMNLLGGRRMTYVVVEKAGQDVIYVNMHVQHRSQNNKYEGSEDAIQGTVEGKGSYYNLVQTVRSYERMKTFELAQAKIEALLQTYPNAEVVITGDFNDTKAGAIRDFCGGGADADGVYDVAIDGGYHDAALNAKTNGGNLTTTWNSYFTNTKEGQAKEVTDKTPLGSTAGTDGRIDFCFVSDGVTVNCYQTGAPYGQAGESGRQYYLSDHLSLIVDIVF